MYGELIGIEDATGDVWSIYNHHVVGLLWECVNEEGTDMFYVSVLLSSADRICVYNGESDQEAINVHSKMQELFKTIVH